MSLKRISPYVKKDSVNYRLTGQDGAYLAELLLTKGYSVRGIKRRTSPINADRIDHIYHDPHEKGFDFTLHHGDFADSSSLIRIIEKVQQSEIYNPATQNHVRARPTPSPSSTRIGSPQLSRSPTEFTHAAASYSQIGGARRARETTRIPVFQSP